MAHSAGQSYGAKPGFCGRLTTNADCRRFWLTIRARSLVREILVSRDRKFSAFSLDNGVTGRSLTGSSDGHHWKAPDPFSSAGVRARSASRSAHAMVRGDNTRTKATLGHGRAQLNLPHGRRRRQANRRKSCVAILCSACGRRAARYFERFLDERNRASRRGIGRGRWSARRRVASSDHSIFQEVSHATVIDCGCVGCNAERPRWPM
jgi:hypothetical protein